MELSALNIDELGDLNATLKSIAETARKLVSADLCIVLAINPITNWFLKPALIVGDPSDVEQIDLDNLRIDDISARALKEGIQVIQLGPENREYSQDPKNLKSIVAVPLLTRGESKPLAVLCLGFHRHWRTRFNRNNRLKLFANQSVDILQATWLLRRYREVARIGQEINQELQTHKILFSKLHSEMADILDTSYFFMLGIHQPQTSALDLYMNEKGVFKFAGATPVEGASAAVMETKRSCLVRHYSNEWQKLGMDFVQIPETEPEQPESLIFVPLVLRDVPLGVLSVQHLTANAYNHEDLQIMELLGNQVALALSDLRLFRYLEDINVTARQLTLQLDSEQLLQEVVDRIREATKADLVSLYPYLQGEQEFEMPFRHSGRLLRPEFPKPSLVRADDIAWLSVVKGEPVFVKDSSGLYEELGGNPKNRKGSFEVREQVRSTVAAPLRVGDESVGVLFVNFRKPQRFDAPQKNLIHSLATYSAVAIKNSRTFGDLSLRRVKELEALRKIDRQISRSLNLEQVLQAILKHATKRIHADDAAILLYNPFTNDLEAKATIGHNAGSRLQEKVSVRGTGLTAWVYKNKAPLRVGNVLEDSEWKDLYRPSTKGVLSELDVPLLDDDEVVGVINFESVKENSFTREDEDFLTTLAGQAVLAIKNAQTYARQQEMTRELTAIQEVGADIVSRLKLQDVLDTILEKALELTESTAGQVLLYDRQRGDLCSEARRGISRDRIQERVPVTWGTAGWVMNNKTLLNKQIAPPWSESFEPSLVEHGWELAVPIMENNDVRGVIDIASIIENPFTKYDEGLLTKLADLATIAIQNADQFEKAETGKKRLEALHKVVEKIIGQQDDPELVIRIVIQSAMALSEAEVGTLHLYEAGTVGKIYVNKEGAEGVELPADKIDLEEGAGNIMRGIVELVAETRSSYLTSGSAQEDPHYKGGTEIHSEVAVPLLSRDMDLIGVLNLESPRRFAFDDEDRELLELFAGQVVLAIQNARTYSAARDESKRFQLLWQAGRELGEITDISQLDTAYDIVVRQVMENYRGEVLLRRYEESSEEIVLVKVGREGLIPPIPRIKKTEGVNGQVAQELRTIMVPDVINPPPGVAEPLRSGSGIEALIVTPIQFRGRYYGNLALTGDEPDCFEDGDVKLLEGLAQHIALTIHRLEAAQAQKDAEQQTRSLEIFTELGQSAYELTHRLGNDLGLVRQYVNIVREELAAQGIESAAIDQELGKLVKDVGNVLNMSRGLKQKVAGLGDEGRLAQDTSTLQAKTLLLDAKWALPIAPENVSVAWDVDEDIASVCVVPAQIIDIVYNLVTNAIEAIPDGGAITIRAFNIGAIVQIEVADTGPGIPIEKQAKIFNLFYSTKKSSGFGLWSSRRYARANGGDLMLESQLGAGSKFVLQLPIVDKQV